MTKERGIVLLSGGLDCTAALAFSISNFDVDFALTFDYGQKAFEQEFEAASKIADFYNIKHEIIELGWLKSLVNNEIPEFNENDFDNSTKTEHVVKKLLIPNRNAVFVNIAAAFADASENSDNVIIIGTNKEEAQNFRDNSYEFIDAVNLSLKYSTNSNIKVYAPLSSLTKAEIIKLALVNKAPLEYIYSCYSGTKNHCGKCMSCQRLYRAIKTLEYDNFIKLKTLFFGEYNEL